MRLLPRNRCFRYAHTGHQKTAELRGLTAFKTARIIKALLRPLTGHGRVRIGAGISRPCHDELLFVLMPSSAQIADYVEWCRTQPGRSTVVDAHADVLRLVPKPASAMAVSHDGRGDRDGWDWWAHPDRQDALHRGIVAADVVTTPWPQMVEPLRELNPNVILLPDFDLGNNKPWFDGFNQVMKTVKSPTTR